MKLINNRYKLVDILRRDLFGITYVASDLSNSDRKVLLNLLKEENKDRKFIGFLIDEFIKLSSIKHPYIQGCKCFNVINTIDNKRAKDIRYFYTTEYYKEHLIHYKSFSTQQINRLFVKLCYVLQYLHFRGITYRLLNFENMFFHRNGSSMDFKLRDIVTIYKHMNNINSIDKYNAQFIAPEIKLGEKGSFSSDIYSLGVILFYMVSGFDYKERTFNEVFKKNTNEKFEKIIERMTVPDPNSRYKNILDVIEDSKQYMPIDFGFFDKDYYEKLYFNIPLVNRKREKKLILQTINENLLAKSKNNIIFVHGETGIGKSRLVKEISFQVAMSRTNVCTIELNHENNKMLYIYKKILRFIVRNYKINDNLINKYGSELVKILPDIASKWDVKPSETLSEDKEILRLNNRISNFINDFSIKNPFLIIVDNIHFIHKNDLNILEYLIKKNSSLIILSTYIDEESKDIRKFLNKCKIDERAKFIRLTRLNFEETSEMLKNILGIHKKPLKLTTKIMEEANGNPRYVEEIIKNLFMDKKIIINDDRLWTADIDDIYNLKLPSSIDDVMLRSVNLLDAHTKNVLNIISIFYLSAPLEIIMQIIDIDEVSLSKILKNLVSFKIINEKFQDWGYSYDYYNKQLKEHIYNNISEVDRKLYHKNAANILEDFYISEGRDYAVELVYHLTNCDEFDKAIKYCIKSAEKMEQLHIYNQAIDFYNRAIELLNQHQNIKMLVDILMKIGLIYINIGEHNNAFDIYIRVSSIANEYKLEKEFIDIQNKLAYIYSHKNEKETAERIIKESIEDSKKIGYIDGELEGGLLKCKLYASTKNHSNLKALLNKYINISLKYLKYYYAGEFFNEKGKMYYDQGEMTKSQYCYKQSIFFFEKSNNDIKTSRPLNNIGIIYFEAYKQIERARLYYYEALSLVEKYNYITGKQIYLMNIGETYLYEDRYNEAIDYFNKAVDISIEIGDKNILFSSYIHLCDTYLSLYQYDKAHFYLKKSESEFNNYCGYGIYYYYYYVIHIYFYIQIYNYSKAEKWYESFIKNMNGLNVDFDLEQKIKELEMYKIQYEFQKNKTINVDYVKKFLHENIDKIHLRLIRNFLMDLICFLMDTHEVESARYFIDLDADLMDRFNTEIFDLKREFVLGLFSNDKIKFYKNLLNKLENNRLYEYQWRIFKAIGDEFHKKNDHFNALNNYILALDILKTLVYKIPEGLRQDYVFNYKLNYILKEKIEDLKSIILIQNSNKDYKKIDREKKRNVEEIFDFSDLNEFFNNKEFMKSIYKEFRQEIPCGITELKDLIQELRKDDFYNIELILRYCSYICLAERGFIFLTNDNNEIKEIISIANHEITEDIKEIVKIASHKEHDIIVTNENQFSKNSFKHNEIKSLICIPIKNSDKVSYNDNARYNRRKYVDNIDKKEIVGYIYLDTKRVFNNFTLETYKKCCLLKTLLYIMIENYNLKKISSIDKLTNLYLRKHVEDLFRKEILLAKKNQLCLSVIMCDIDRFKQVNDLYGHRKGDEVLAKLGKILKNNLRKNDLVGRYGGEEFIIILPRTNLEDALVVCEKLRKIIEDSKLMGTRMDLTLSFGISSFPVHGTSEEELIEKADQALYKSKKSGRNRTTIWNENIGYNKYRYDKLAGIITGNISTDHKNINIIMDMIELLKSSHSKSDRLFKVLGYIIEMSEARYGAVFDIDEDKKIKRIYARQKGSNIWVKDFKYNKEIIKEFMDNKQGDYFINWNEITEIDSFTGVPSWNSYVVVPIIKDGVQKGIILLSVPIDEKEFDFSTFNLVNSLSGIIASML
ncbi:diguanylate cyclase [Paramaledivibacter caminithermalis]|uniref:Diguanylate cyclase (GGDEF) domain-containing protein n=1 Tax=Paramaledivibacter caminithermalis (strain DSM 15212 / CIP 107654 / DViRD3) TaxID=1121301 RepID=A0A1M6Q5G1_PARC5|nr:diguanylate cyclase [Paramaledivibacter caminithermalis]SHK15504.1 diguanylate cyclase (GGDEF) domain-containing protein [Paramaledivibacter caminithermalis DSM 15212]